MKRTITAKSVFMDDFEISLSIEVEKSSMKCAKEQGKKAEYEHHKRCFEALLERANRLKDHEIKVMTDEKFYRSKIQLWKLLAILTSGISAGMMIAWLSIVFRLGSVVHL